MDAPVDGVSHKKHSLSAFLAEGPLVFVL